MNEFYDVKEINNKRRYQVGLNQLLYVKNMSKIKEDYNLNTL